MRRCLARDDAAADNRATFSLSSGLGVSRRHGRGPWLEDVVSRYLLARWLRSYMAVVAASWMMQAPLPAEPPQEPLTAEQRQQLAKANRLEGEVIALYQQGHFREAVVLAQQVREIRKQVLGEKHPDYATSLHNLAKLYRSQGDYARAEPLCAGPWRSKSSRWATSTPPTPPA